MARELIGPALPPGFPRCAEADPDEDFSQGEARGGPTSPRPPAASGGLPRSGPGGRARTRGRLPVPPRNGRTGVAGPPSLGGGGDVPPCVPRVRRRGVSAAPRGSPRVCWGAGRGVWWWRGHPADSVSRPGLRRLGGAITFAGGFYSGFLRNKKKIILMWWGTMVIKQSKTCF